MSGKILLVLCNSNYGDEFDVQGFALFKDDVWKEYIKEVKNRIFTVERYAGDEFGPHVADIGTNQYIGFGNFDEYKSSFRTKVLTPEEAKRLRSLFGIKVNKSAEDPSVYGMFLMLNPDEVEDEEYEDEDEECICR